MSFETWHTYGYGVLISDLKNVSMDKVVALIQTAPKIAEAFNEWREEENIEEVTPDDLVDFDEYNGYGLATILQDIIEEREGISLTICRQYDQEKYYLLYGETYPWFISDAHKNLTEEDIQSLFVKYLSQITDEAITIDYYGPEDGG